MSGEHSEIGTGYRCRSTAIYSSLNTTGGLVGMFNISASYLVRGTLSNFVESVVAVGCYTDLVKAT